MLGCFLGGTDNEMLKVYWKNKIAGGELTTLFHSTLFKASFHQKGCRNNDKSIFCLMIISFVLVEEETALIDQCIWMHILSNRQSSREEITLK